MKFTNKIICFIIGIIILLILNYFLAIRFLNYFLLNIETLNIIIFTNHLGESLSNILFLDLVFTIIQILPIIVIWFYTSYKDALFEKEKRFLKLLSIPYILALIGCLFSYYVTIHYMIPFLVGYNLEIAITNYLNLTSILEFTLLNMLYFGIVFQTPIIVYLLIKYDIIEKTMFKEYRRHFFVVVLIIAAIITPADPFSMLFIAIPTHILYEIGILIA